MVHLLASCQPRIIGDYIPPKYQPVKAQSRRNVHLFGYSLTNFTPLRLVGTSRVSNLYFN